MVQHGAVLVAVAALTFARRVSAHGWITKPISRIELVANHHQDGMPDDTLRYCPSCSAGPNSCGATDTTYVQSLAVWQKFYDSAGVTVPAFAPGEEIGFTMRITADHGGQGWLMLSCADRPAENITWYLIDRAPGDRDHHLMPSTPKAYAWAMGESGGSIKVSYKMPNELSCPTGRGVGRWLWKTAHQCNDVNNVGRKTEPFVLKEFAAAVHQHSPGVWINENCTARPPETFIMCFDFTTATGPSPPPPPPVPTPAPLPPIGKCHSISAVVTDDWCQTNCHATSPNCPPDMCKCGPAAASVSGVESVKLTDVGRQPADIADVTAQISSDEPASYHEAPLRNVDRVGYIPRHYGAIYLEDANLPNSTLDIAQVIPERFDAREQWPQCASVIGRIRDQSDCGACWAFGTTMAFNDRLCIATGNTDIILSPWDTLTNAAGMGCGGGNPDQTWQWLSSTGVVTGGDFFDVGKGTTCQPYKFGFCNHHEASKNYKMCPPPNCPGGCKLPGGSRQCSEQSFSKSYSADKHRAASAYSIRGVGQMQTEIMTYGPITVGFDVYQNWEFYRGGVYTSTDATAFMGGHAVKVIGWGVCTDCKVRYICHSLTAAVPDSWCLTNCLLAHPYNCPPATCSCDPPYPPTAAVVDETPTPYWLVANSWNPDWGEKGFFRMLRGSNICGIEGAHVSAGHATAARVIV